MKKRAAIFWVLGALLLGNSLPHRFTLPLEAAPADVTGSPNIAVDTYRNIAGTFILWSNGKITNAEGGPTDLGHPYGPPPPEAKIGKQTLEEKRSLGAPKVAIKAIPRKDGTYILFADGTLQKPANGAAAAGDSSSKVVAGVFGVTRIQGGDMTVNPSSPEVQVQGNKLQIKWTPGPNAMAIFFTPNVADGGVAQVSTVSRLSPSGNNAWPWEAVVTGGPSGSYIVVDP